MLDLPVEAVEMVESMLSLNPNGRPTAE